MIVEIRINNYRVYANPVLFSMKADMRIKKFHTNIFKTNTYNVVKVSCIYGGNNVGKTWFISAISTIKNVLLSLSADVSVNMFSNNKKCSFGITFIYKDNTYSYDFEYDTTIISGSNRGFVYEKLSTISIDEYGNEKISIIFERDIENNSYYFANNESITKLLSSVSSSNILIYTINAEKYQEIKKYKEILTEFANKIDIVDMNNIPIQKTINMLKTNDVLATKVVEFIKMADIEIDDFSYAKDFDPQVSIDGNGENIPKEVALQKTQLEDILRLQSSHKGRRVSSILFDSTGTKKIVALAGFVIDSIINGRILVIDEFDSSLHFKLTRGIVSFFNNNVNSKGQLICAVHDITLLDCKYLLRKDQIWFVNKKANGAELKPLSDFTYQKDSVRSETDIMSKYESGLLGDIPDPDFVSVMLNEEDDDE